MFIHQKIYMRKRCNKELNLMHFLFWNARLGREPYSLIPDLISPNRSRIQQLNQSRFAEIITLTRSRRICFLNFSPEF